MTSHRQVFRSSAIIGGSSVINMLIGIVKVKVLAVLLGPVGIGLMGLYLNVMSIASTLAGCGMASSGVRQVASSADDAETLAVVRRALWLGSLILGVAGMAILWLLGEQIAQWVFGDRVHASEVGWLGVGLLFTLIAGSQTALLQGMRLITDLAWVSILSALVAALVGVFAVYLLGKEGVLWFVLTAPAANFLVVTYYTARLPQPTLAYNLTAIKQQWLALLKLGIPLMAAGLIMLVTQLAVRSIVLRELGLDASGYFQASWAISFTYIGFVLNAMAMDYFPRLTKAINDHEQAEKLVNEQAEMALLLAGPVLIAMITLAPWIIDLLYTQSFSPAAEILRWQVLGDIFKVASVPLVFIFLATGHGGVAIGTQLIWSAAYLGPLVLGIGEFGLVMAGVGFFLAYLIYYVVVAIFANKLIGFKLTPRNGCFTLLLLVCAATIMFFTTQSVTAGYTVGLLAMLLVSAYSLRRLDHLIGLREWLHQKFVSVRD
ncbi:MAG: PST family polysaccharide transporter [Oceanicoccus sp.]|jgi:PST family polysaccharide transporter